MDVARIPRALAALRVADPSFALFGSSGHRYRLDPPASEAGVAAFERRHGFTLPGDYRAFLTECGNGGAGPFYGLFPLGMWDGAGSGLEPLQFGELYGSPAVPFPHREAWNLPAERFAPPAGASAEEEDAFVEALDREYWAPERSCGVLPIATEGCALRPALVLVGPERGNVWLDARADQRGWLPIADGAAPRIDFARWYGRWLDDALARFGVRPEPPLSSPPP